jgi:O-methyltransferase
MMRREIIQGVRKIDARQRSVYDPYVRLIKQYMANLAEKFGIKLVSIKRHKGPKEDMDPSFAPLYEECKEYTLVHVERMYSLYKAVQYVVKKGIPGDFVECGVWKGGASMLMAKTLLEMGGNDRTIYMYDTYEGMTKPTKEDCSVVSGTTPVEKIWKREQAEDHNNWCYGPIEGVKEVMASTGYPPNKLVFVKGPVEETIPNTMPKQIALLRLDTDWYNSTKHEMEHLFPLLAPGGILILDDYGYWAGARQAVDEYLEKNNITLFLHRDDYSGSTGIRN